MRIYLARHGQTIWNKQLRYQGQTDIPLSDAGLEQSRLLSEKLAHLSGRPIEIHTSDLLRSRQTADSLAERLGFPVSVHPGLREASFGEWEGLTFDAISELYPAAWAAWRQNPAEATVPGAESRSDFAWRVLGAVEEIISAKSGGRLSFFGEGTLIGPRPGSIAEVLSEYAIQKGDALADLAGDGGKSAFSEAASVLAAPRSVKEVSDEELSTIIVSHGGVVKTIIAHALGLGFDSYWKIRVDNCSLSIIDVYEEGCILATLNDTSHLASASARRPDKKVL